MSTIKDLITSYEQKVLPNEVKVKLDAVPIIAKETDSVDNSVDKWKQIDTTLTLLKEKIRSKMPEALRDVSELENLILHVRQTHVPKQKPKEKESYTRKLQPKVIDPSLLANLRKTDVKLNEIDSGKYQMVGIIIIGNSGVGKSFIANNILGKNRFKNLCSARSVTSETERDFLPIGDFIGVIFNIPGLIEIDSLRVDSNKTEIQKAFEQCPYSIICYVLGNQGGRIRDEDVVAFHAIDKAYHIKRESLCFAVNCLSPYRDKSYEGETIKCLSELLKISTTELRIEFCDMLGKMDRFGEKDIRSKLLNMLVTRTPNIHEKKQNILLFRDEIANLHSEVSQQQEEFKNKIDLYKQDVQRLQQEYDDLKNQPPKEIHHIRTVVEYRSGGGGGCSIS